MMKVVLDKLRFYSTHGVHAEESLSGGVFEVNLSAYYSPVSLPILHLHQTVDYTALYDIIKKRMHVKTALLETLATEIAMEILEKFEIINQVNISINKLNTPIVNFEGVAGVSFELKRNNK